LGIPLPPLPIQSAFAETVARIEAIARALADAAAKAEAIAAALSAEVFDPASGSPTLSRALRFGLLGA
jgi:type I restriction enzyme, S subunit